MSFATDRVNLAKLACLYTSQIPSTRRCKKQCATIKKLVNFRRNSNVVKNKFGVRRNSNVVKNKFGVRSNRNITKKNCGPRSNSSSKNTFGVRSNSSNAVKNKFGVRLKRNPSLSQSLSQSLIQLTCLIQLT